MYNNITMKQLYNRYFPTPSYLAMDSFAIDISDQSIKYGQLLATPFGLQLGKFGKEKIPAGIVVLGKIEQEDKLINILKKIKDKEHLSFIRVSLPEEQMYLFTLSLPKTNENDLRNMILLQMEEHIPLQAIDTIFDYEIVSSSDKNILVEVSAISGATLEGYLSVFEKAGLTPISFELEAQAIARAVISTLDIDPVMIVDFGDTRTGVSIVHDGKVFFTTTLDMGGVNLTNMIAKNFSLSSEKAEEMKRSYGLDGISNIEDIFPIILNGISVLRDELNKQYIYWKDHDNYGIKHEQISRIILCGGDANLIGLSEYLESSMMIKVEHANTWINISNMSISVPDMSFEESLSYATVLGLALGGFTYESQPIINVLPFYKKNIIANEYWKRFFVVFFGLSSLMVTIACFLLLPSYFFSSSKLSIAENKLEVFNNENIDLTSNDLDTAISDINSKLKLLLSVKSKYSVSNDILGTILSDRPEGVTFSQILLNQKKDKGLTVEVSGKARDRAALRAFKLNIDNNTKIASSVLPISDFLEKTDLNFTISLVMK